MPDLEQKISVWRAQMRCSGIHSEEVLAELESHLRDTLAALLTSGLALDQAFAQAAAQLGQPHDLHQEYSKLLASMGVKAMKRIAVGFGIFLAYMVVLAFVCPVLGKAGVSEPALKGFAMSAIVLGAACSFFAAYKFRSARN